MAERIAGLVFALDLLLVAAAFWALTDRRWRAAAGIAVAFAGSLPMLVAALAGQFRPGALLILLASGLLGIVIGMGGRGPNESA